MSDRSIGETAELLGVSTRTLRHWDSIGLLSPTWRSSTGYRLYTDADLRRGLQILLYRATGVPLREIDGLLAHPHTVRGQLLRQRELLAGRITQLHRMVRAVDEILKEDTMSTEDMIAIFGDDLPGYREQARQRWGESPEWEQSQQVLGQLSPAELQVIKDEQEAFVAALADAAAAGVAPGSAEGAALARRHRDTIGRWYEVSPAKQVLLARMYIEDERFNATYQGNAGYLLTLVEALAAAEGVDLGDVRWE